MVKLDLNNFVQRLLSGIAIIGIIIIAIYGSFEIFTGLFLIIFGLMFWEWYEITKSDFVDIVTGIGLILIALASLLQVKLLKNSDTILLWYFATIWSFDSFAMIGGKFIGGRKLAEKISPQKTWSGVICGLYAAVLITSLIFGSINFKNFAHFNIFSRGFVLPTSIICIAAHAGDLLESYYKRKYKIKDSGNIIPGHGGILDRFDSVIFSSPILLIILIM